MAFGAEMAVRLRGFPGGDGYWQFDLAEVWSWLEKRLAVVRAFAGQIWLR